MQASRSTATATGAANDADEEDAPKEVVCFYNREGRKAPKKNVTKVIVGPDVVRIDKNTFQRYKFLKEVDMSNATSLQIIAEYAFWGCHGLALVKWPPNLNTIGEYAFNKCTSLKEADMSKLHALETIGDSAFAYCSALALVKWPPNLKTIGKGAFSDCTSLKEADMSMLHALETIGIKAFEDCSALALVKWSPNLKNIGYRAFQECPLHDIMIPSRRRWFVRKLPLDETKLQSVDMQGHDLKKAIRLKNLYPRATPRLTMNRLVSMHAKSPLTAAQLENAAQSDEGVTEEDWADARLGDLQRLEEIQKAYAGSIFNLLHWYAGNGLAENLFVNRSNEM